MSLKQQDAGITGEASPKFGSVVWWSKITYMPISEFVQSGNVQLVHCHSNFFFFLRKGILLENFRKSTLKKEFQQKRSH